MRSVKIGLLGSRWRLQPPSETRRGRMTGEGEFSLRKSPTRPLYRTQWSTRHFFILGELRAWMRGFLATSLSKGSRVGSLRMRVDESHHCTLLMLL